MFDKFDKVKESTNVEILRMNYKYVHTPLNLLQNMATNDVLPNSLANCTFPVCKYFIYGKEIICPRKTKTVRSINKYKPVASVGDCLSANVLVSSTHGTIGQMSGFLTLQIYRYR